YAVIVQVLESGPARVVFPDRFVRQAGAARDVHPFPTRRSSDLCRRALGRGRPARAHAQRQARLDFHAYPPGRPQTLSLDHDRLRSEEHTSELQSRFDLVCRLLLETKNTTERQHAYTTVNDTSIS